MIGHVPVIDHQSKKRKKKKYPKNIFFGKDAIDIIYYNLQPINLIFLHFSGQLLLRSQPLVHYLNTI